MYEESSDETAVSRRKGSQFRALSVEERRDWKENEHKATENGNACGERRSALCGLGGRREEGLPEAIT